ncbi:hypothetical protein LSAT2_001816 [Lamellibrachia satsuma]|nr:hypothetical protein LSAT2_001816 [Lamellibrachia satsuma]
MKWSTAVGECTEVEGRQSLTDNGVSGTVTRRPRESPSTTNIIRCCITHNLIGLSMYGSGTNVLCEEPFLVCKKLRSRRVVLTVGESHRVGTD